MCSTNKRSLFGSLNSKKAASPRLEISSPTLIQPSLAGHVGPQQSSQQPPQQHQPWRHPDHVDFVPNMPPSPGSKDTQSSGIPRIPRPGLNRMHSLEAENSGAFDDATSVKSVQSGKAPSSRSMGWGKRKQGNSAAPPVPPSPLPTPTLPSPSFPLGYTSPSPSNGNTMPSPLPTPSTPATGSLSFVRIRCFIDHPTTDPVYVTLVPGETITSLKSKILKSDNDRFVQFRHQRKPPVETKWNDNYDLDRITLWTGKIDWLVVSKIKRTFEKTKHFTSVLATFPLIPLTGDQDEVISLDTLFPPSEARLRGLIEIIVRIAPKDTVPVAVSFSDMPDTPVIVDASRHCSVGEFKMEVAKARKLIARHSLGMDEFYLFKSEQPRFPNPIPFDIDNFEGLSEGSLLHDEFETLDLNPLVAKAQWAAPQNRLLRVEIVAFLTSDMEDDFKERLLLKTGPNHYSYSPNLNRPGSVKSTTSNNSSRQNHPRETARDIAENYRRKKEREQHLADEILNGYANEDPKGGGSYNDLITKEPAPFQMSPSASMPELNVKVNNSNNKRTFTRPTDGHLSNAEELSPTTKHTSLPPLSYSAPLTEDEEEYAQNAIQVSQPKPRTTSLQHSLQIQNRTIEHKRYVSNSSLNSTDSSEASSTLPSSRDYPPLSMAEVSPTSKPAPFAGAAPEPVPVKEPPPPPMIAIHHRTESDNSISPYQQIKPNPHQQPGYGPRAMPHINTQYVPGELSPMSMPVSRFGDSTAEEDMICPSSPRPQASPTFAPRVTLPSVNSLSPSPSTSPVISRNARFASDTGSMKSPRSSHGAINVNGQLRFHYPVSTKRRDSHAPVAPARSALKGSRKAQAKTNKTVNRLSSDLTNSKRVSHLGLQSMATAEPSVASQKRSNRFSQLDLIAEMSDLNTSAGQQSTGQPQQIALLSPPNSDLGDIKGSGIGAGHPVNMEGYAVIGGSLFLLNIKPVDSTGAALMRSAQFQAVLRGASS